MKKLLLLFVLSLGCLSLVKAQYHQDSIYFFMKLKNPKATFTINKPKMKDGYSEYMWAFYINKDNNQCTGDVYVSPLGAPGKKFPGVEMYIGITKHYFANADTTGPITVSLANKQYFDVSIMRYQSPGYYTASPSVNYYFTGDTGIYIVANRNDTALVGLDNNDDYFARTIYKHDSLTTTVFDFNQIKPLDVINPDLDGDMALGVVDILGSKIYNANAGVGTTTTYVLGSASYDSAGVNKPLLKGKARFYNEGKGTDIVLVATMNINNGSFTGNAPLQGRYRVLITPDSALYNVGIVPTYFGNAVYWNNANMVQICVGDTQIVNVQLKKADVGLGGSNSIQGYLLNGNGPRKPGEPVRGAGIVVEQIPGGAQAYRTTDVNGFYNITDLPSGNFKVTVNLPGKEMKAVFNTSLDAAMNDIDTALFFANDTLIYSEDTKLTVDSAYKLSAKPIELKPGMRVYPNPAKGLIYVTIEGKKEEVLTFELFDIRGQRVYSKTGQTKTSSSSTFVINEDQNLENGYYILKIHCPNEVYNTGLIIDK